jgi:hypothetical protein
MAADEKQADEEKPPGAFKALTGAINGAIAVAALIPGVMLLSGLVKLPPDFNQLLTICGSVLAPVLVLLTLLGRPWIARLRPPVAAALCVLLLVAGFVAAFDYWRFAKAHVIPVAIEGDFPYAGEAERKAPEPIVWPSRPSDALLNLVADEETIADARYGPKGDEVAKQLAIDSAPDQWRMFIELLAAEALLLLGFLLAAWRGAALLEAKPEEP